MSMTVARGGVLVHLPNRLGKGVARKGGKRGKVQGFSKGSRLRLRQLFDSIDRRQVSGVFYLELTAPPGEYLTWANHQTVFRKWYARFEREHRGKRWSLIWRVEPHPGDGPRHGEPHFHVCVIWLDPMPSPGLCTLRMRAWNDRAWAEVLSCPAAGVSGCRVKWITDWSQAAYYRAKYLSKIVEEAPEGTGRMWGVRRRSLIPVDLHNEQVEGTVAGLMRRVLVKHQRRQRTRVEVFIPSDLCWEFGLSSAGWHRLKDLRQESVAPVVVWKRGQLREVTRRVRVGVSIAEARSRGLRLRVKRPRLLCRVRAEDGGDPEHWAEQWDSSDVDRYGNPYSVKRIVSLGRSPLTVSPVNFTIKEETATKLLTWAKGRYVDRLIESATVDDVPF